MKINKISTIKGILTFACAVVVFLFLLVYCAIIQYTGPFLFYGLIMWFCGSLFGTIVSLRMADLEIENERLKVICLFRVKTINLNEFIINGMDKASQGMFYLSTNIGSLSVCFNYKNYLVIKQAIPECKESKITLEQLKILGQEGAFVRPDLRK